MAESEVSALYQRIGRLRWQAPIIAVLLVLAHQYVEHTLLRSLPHWQHFLSQVLFYGIVGPCLAWWALTSLQRQVRETQLAERALKQAHARLRKANQRLSFLIRVSRRLAEADDEASLLEAILALPEEVLPAAAVTLVRLDERGQPLPPRYHSHLPPDVVEAWMAHLTNAQVGTACAACRTQKADLAAPCPLLHAAPATAGVQKVVCLALERGPRRYGLLNIYVQEAQRPTEDEQSLLRAMAGEIALALESHALRSRELAMLSRLQETHWWRDLQEHLQGVLQHAVVALEADGGAFFVDPFSPAARRLQVTEGGLAPESLRLVKGLAEGSREGSSPLVVQGLEQQGLEDVRSLLAASLQVEGKSVGTFALWAAEGGAFSRRQAQLAAVVAGQAALLVENQRLSLQVEHQAALAERTRLAREIHDGLAQTLGYLKLRTAHLAEDLRVADKAPLMADLHEVQALLDAAYVDAREAIDGLQLSTEGTDLQSWVEEAAGDFEILSGVPVSIAAAPEVHLPREVHAQLQRIVQEALSNVRKHAAADGVRIGWDVQDDAALVLQIEDDGRGFELENVSRRSRHGLRIMRERAELLGAELQIASRRGQGTCVTLRLPQAGAAGR